MTMPHNAYDELLAKYRECSVLGSVSGLLQWDMQTIMPPKGAEQRGNQLALLSGIVHDRLTHPRIGELLEDLAHDSSLSDEQKANVREIRRDYLKATKIPKDLVEELSRHETVSHEAWVKARAAGDFAAFAPYLEKMVALCKRQAECLGYQETPLDALIDLFEPQGTVSMFTELFNQVKKANVPLLNKIAASKVKAGRDFLKRAYAPDKQKKFGELVMQQIGFDTDGGRLDISVHPFCSGMYGDVRITTRYNKNAPQQALFGIIHESGHALYEQGVNHKQLGTPLAEALSYGLHESQSRMWENFVGRSQPFWKFFYPKLKAIFPTQLRDVNLSKFVLAVNHVERSLVRVEADEMTYDLHIILRFEIERDLFAGTISVNDLPKVWNRKMEEYLGLTPPNDGKEGVLQDVHWSGGMFGYFPSYSLGNMAAAQLWHAMRRAVPAMDEQMAKGNFAEILQWLREHVHRHGRRFGRDELLKKATGKPLGTEDYIRYLREKYSALYKI